MLILKDIVKEYRIGDDKVVALNGISLKFRKSEFVSILGPSGCGKTTLLNIIGGLDKYTTGDLIINGKSTKQYADSDWDAYRNHSIGFVFQSYNLIPHQTVLSNVELALTLSGVSREERRKRAEEALEKVGLKKQMNKKPNQLSGGQMQRVAIARALVNNPDILLADEPTGALDSETSIQVMDILREISEDKLIIMVTHNPELAKNYSSRIIKVIDGRVIDDTNPYDGSESETEQIKPDKRKKDKLKKPSMSFFTALFLSLNNLMTKKARTFMTSFAGSIGIIGIALILSVSSGVNRYITQVQEETLASYPITIESESVDLTNLMTSLMGAGSDENEEESRSADRVYSSDVMYDMTNSLASAKTNLNNLKAFKEYIDNSEDFKLYASAVQYSYDTGLNIYTTDTNGKIISSDMNSLMESVMSEMGASDELSANSSSSVYSSMSNFNVWEEMLPGDNGEIISPLIKSQYDLLYGTWPEKYNEVVLIVDKNNQISDYVLYSLGLKPFDEMVKVVNAAMMGNEVESESADSWSYDEILGQEFKLILSSDKYQHQENGTYIDLTSTDTGLSYLYSNEDTAEDIKVVGVIRVNDDAVATMMTGAIGYTSALTNHVIKESQNKEIINAQLEEPSRDIITGLPFASDEDKNLNDEGKIQKVIEYLDSLNETEKAAAYAVIMSIPSQDYIEGVMEQNAEEYTREEMEAMMTEAYASEMGVTDTSSIESYFGKMDEEALEGTFKKFQMQMIAAEYAKQIQMQLQSMTIEQILSAFESEEISNQSYVTYFENYMPASVSESTYEENLKLLGYVDESNPSSISIYSGTFNDKDHLSDLIKEYNQNADGEEEQIKYTDYVALMMSSISTVINAITYVLIAFVAISLVVSSIMIGIITYVSVLERTKEIGILRSIGASKRDISRVFNAETLIVGFAAGAIGIGVTLLLIIPINIIIHHLTGIMTLSAALPVWGGITLVIISMVLTFIAGLIPSKIAAKKDPVVALRTE